MTQIVETIPNEIVRAWMQGEPVSGNTRPSGSDGATK